MRSRDTAEPKRRHVTKIELLVATTLAATLVGCVQPVLQQAQKRSAQSKAMQQAKGISLAIKYWSHDNDGAFPVGNNANEAFAQLFPELGSETPFFVRSSAWHGAPGTRFAHGPDQQWGENIGVSEPQGEPLEPGENHWAYNLR